MEEQEGKLPSEIVGLRGMEGFAALYERYPEEIAKLRGACLVQYAEDEEFDAREYTAFKLGVATVLNFFITCRAEAESIAKDRALEELKRKQKS